MHRVSGFGFGLGFAKAIMNGSVPGGFVDLQVNGFKEVDFSTPGLTVQQVRHVVEQLRSRGTLAFCPTLVTSSISLYQHNLPVIARAMEEPDLKESLLGIHLEGPFISPRDGFRGAHSLQNVLPPSVELFQRLIELSRHNVRVLTLAPELPGAGPLIEYAVGEGILVCLGHHEAGRDEIREACERGARVSTHLGNGIANLLPRHPNPLWEQLDEERLAVSLITDGHHLPPAFIGVAVRVKGPDNVIVVSDSTSLAGCPPGEYESLEQRVVLEETGRIWNPAGNFLVGSSACLFDCMNHLSSLGLFTEEELWRVGYHNPLALLKSAPPRSECRQAAWRNGRFDLI
jgi:N-acetylglucosamine-6-phosphate deacetylase